MMRPTDYLANQRTYLAYVRTALSLLSLGISANRFALYLLERNRIPESSGAGHTLVSVEAIGIGMALVGLLLLAWGTIASIVTTKQLDRGLYRSSTRSMWALSTLILVAALSGIWVLFSH